MGNQSIVININTRLVASTYCFFRLFSRIQKDERIAVESKPVKQIGCFQGRIEEFRCLPSNPWYNGPNWLEHVDFHNSQLVSWKPTWTKKRVQHLGSWPPRFQSIFYLSIPRKSAYEDEELTLTAAGPFYGQGERCEKIAWSKMIKPDDWGKYGKFPEMGVPSNHPF